jgi:hypothetical protein
MAFARNTEPPSTLFHELVYSFPLNQAKLTTAKLLRLSSMPPGLICSKFTPSRDL